METWLNEQLLLQLQSHHRSQSHSQSQSHSRLPFLYSTQDNLGGSGLPGSGLTLGPGNRPDDEADCLYLLFFCMLHACTNVWSRLVRIYLGFPWCLAALANDRLDAAVADRILSRFENARPCCLDAAFSQRVRNVMTSPADLKSGGRLHDLIQLLSCQKVLNAKVEDTFARHNSVAQAARGQRAACMVSVV